MEDHTKIINEIWEIINEKENSGDDNSYTYWTLVKGIIMASQMVGEEASVLIIASLAVSKNEIIIAPFKGVLGWLLLLKLSDVDPNEVFQELKNRRK